MAKEMERSNQILDQAGSIVLVLRLDGTIHYINAFGLHFFGYGHDELIGQPVTGTIGPVTDSEGQDLKALMESILTGPSQYIVNENENRRKDDRRIWVSWSNRLARIDGIEEDVLVCVGTDATQRRALEKKLQEQQRLAARSDRLRSLGEMASGMAHEFNQPLSIIRGAAENILIGKERGWPITDEELKTRMSRIVDQTVRLSDLIEHVRVLAKQADVEECQAVRLQVVIDATLRLTRAQFASRGIEFTCENLAEGAFVWGNPFALEEALLALLYNARDAVCKESAKEKKVRLTVETTAVGEEAWLRMTVCDTGSGIPEEVLGLIFDPFFTTKGPVHGTGLGLSSAKAIVDSMGGRIEVHNLEPLGASFAILLPRHETNEGSG